MFEYFHYKSRVWVTLTCAAVITGIILCCSFFNCVPSKNSSMSMSALSFDDTTYPVAILGGGVAGLTAGLYCAQAQIPCLLVEGPKQGGAIAQSHDVRNWPGITSAPGRVIISDIRTQVQNAGATISEEKVTAIDLSSWPRTITLAPIYDETKTRTVKACCIIIALGTEPNYLDIPGEKTLWGKGVSNCAVCDGAFYKGKSVAIVGGGDAAITEADYLADIAGQVTIFVRKDHFKAKDQQAKQKVLARNNVTVRFNSIVTEIVGTDKKVTNLIIKNTQSSEVSEFPCDGLFLAIGSTPNTALFKQKISCDKHGFITLKQGQETSIPGVYAAGDICDSTYVQAITAAGDGCKAALQAIKFLKDHGFSSTKASTKQRDVPSAIKNEPDMMHSAEKSQPDIVAIDSDATFNKHVLKAKKIVLFDIYGEWCGPCQRLKPILHEIAEKRSQTVSLATCDISQQGSNLVGWLNQLGQDPVTSVPTVLVLKNGIVLKRLKGFRSKEALCKELDTL